MIGKLARIDLQNPKALLYMNRALKTVIKNYQSAAFEAEIKMGSKTFDEDRSGYEYMLKSTSNSQHFAWVRFQIVYQEHAEGIWIWFSKGGNATWYERIKATLLRHYPTSLAEEPARDACYVLMTQEAYNAFLSCGSVEEQLRLLADFFADVNRGIEGAFAAPSTIHSEH